MFIRQKCQLCEGVGRCDIIDPITQQKIKDDECAACKGSGIIVTNTKWWDFENWAWRYKKEDREDHDPRGSGENL